MVGGKDAPSVRCGTTLPLSLINQTTSGTWETPSIECRGYDTIDCVFHEMLASLMMLAFARKPLIEPI